MRYLVNVVGGWLWVLALRRRLSFDWPRRWFMVWNWARRVPGPHGEWRW